MKGPKALLSLYETMTIYEGPEGTVVTFRGHRDQNRIYLIDRDGALISEQNLYAADLFSNGMQIYPTT